MMDSTGVREGIYIHSPSGPRRTTQLRHFKVPTGRDYPQNHLHPPPGFGETTLRSHTMEIGINKSETKVTSKNPTHYTHPQNPN